MPVPLECGPNAQFLTKQKRPAAVAFFLNKIPLEERHSATNALLLLGLRAYERAVADAPADVRTLRAVVAMDVANKFDNPQTQVPGMMPARKLVGMKTSLTSSRTPTYAQDPCNEVVVAHLSRHDSTSPKRPAYYPQGEEKGIMETDNGHTTILKSTGTGRGGGGCITAPLFQSTSVLLDQIDRAYENKDNIGAGDLLPRARNESCCYENMNKQQVCSQTPALSFIIRDVLEGTVGQSIAASSSTRSTIGFSNDANMAVHGDDQSTNHDLSAYGVSDGTGGGRGNVVENGNDISTESAPIPLDSIDDEIFPIDFLRCLKKHIRKTNGVRENSLLVAASIPQHLAIYAMHSGFDNLYRDLLTSYHLSNSANRGNTHSPGN